MAWNKDKPLSTDLLTQSQQDLYDNFNAIDTVVEQDHEAFGSGNQGKHKQAIFPQQGAATSTAANEFALYTKTDGANPALFLRKPADGTEINMTTASTAINGYCWLPCGVKMIWGRDTIAAGFQSKMATFTDGGFPNGILIVTVVKTNIDGIGDDSIIIVSAKTKTTVTMSRAVAAHVGTPAAMEYLAIGY